MRERYLHSCVCGRSLHGDTVRPNFPELISPWAETSLVLSVPQITNHRQDVHFSESHTCPDANGALFWGFFFLRVHSSYFLLLIQLKVKGQLCDFYFSVIIKRNIYKMETVSKWRGGVEVKQSSPTLSQPFSVSLWCHKTWRCLWELAPLAYVAIIPVSVKEASNQHQEAGERRTQRRSVS